MLIDRLYKSEKMLQEMKDTYEAVTSNSDSQKDKKIIDLAKKLKQLQVSNEVLKSKAAQAAEFALKLKAETPVLPQEPSELDTASRMPTGSPGHSDDKKVKQLEIRLTKMRNENQEQKILLDKAQRLLEREIGEAIDINDLSKDESQWKGRA